jgi:hypothetical protein
MKRSWIKPDSVIDAEKVQMAEARRRLQAMAVSGVGMSCGLCGHFDDMARFTATPVFGALPLRQYQCPECGWAVELKHGPPTVYPSGFVAPGAVILEPVGARL